MSATVLIIEDNATNRELMSYLLDRYGYAVIEAATGTEGVALADRAKVDLVICDIQLPDMDGFEVVRILKASPDNDKRLPVVAVTALAMVGDRDRILDAGFDGYLSKPLDPRTFVARIEAHLPIRLRSGVTPELAAMSQEDSAPARQSSVHTILVVDDEPDNLHVLQSTLVPSGYGVFLASTGEEALATLGSHRPDLILSDLHLRGEEDFSLLERVRLDPRLADIPYVFLSSTSAKQSLVEKARQKGAQALLFRPIEPEVLLHQLATHLEPA